MTPILRPNFTEGGPDSGQLGERTRYIPFFRRPCTAARTVYPCSRTFALTGPVSHLVLNRAWLPEPRLFQVSTYLRAFLTRAPLRLSSFHICRKNLLTAPTYCVGRNPSVHVGTQHVERIGRDLLIFHFVFCNGICHVGLVPHAKPRAKTEESRSVCVCVCGGAYRPIDE